MLSLDSFLCFIETLESKMTMCIAVQQEIISFDHHYYDGYSLTKLVFSLAKLWPWYGCSTEPPKPNMTNTIPEYFLSRGINHFSPSQVMLPLDQYVFKYLHCKPKQRKNFKQSSKMLAGTEAGQQVEMMLTNLEHNQDYDMDHIDNNAPKRAVFLSTDEKELEQHEQNNQSFYETVFNAIKACKEIGITEHHDKMYENYVSGEFEGIVLPVIGRTDIESKKILIELKTKWRTRGGVKKDGTRSFTKSKVPDNPDENHLKQLAFYSKFKPNLKAFLVYVCEREDSGYKIFEIDNYHPHILMEEFRDDLEVKQNIAKLEDPRKYVKKDFKHWGWNIGEKYFKEAKTYYGYK